MMRFSVLSTIFLAASTNAFMAPSRAFVGREATRPLFETETHIDKDYSAGSGMNEHDIPVFIENLTRENFDESLEMLEPLLTNECVGDICDDYMSQLEAKASEIGMKIPDGYAPSHH